MMVKQVLAIIGAHFSCVFSLLISIPVHAILCKFDIVVKVLFD